MATMASFAESHLEAICSVLGDTSDGLTGSEIGRLLARCNIEDPLPGTTKRYRLFEALKRRQARDRCGNAVAAFVTAAMDPVRFVGEQARFNDLLEHLNRSLAFAGFTLLETGQLQHVAAVRTITEAEARAGRLRAELVRRAVHPDVLRFCRAELLEQNYFHAVLEATKSVADKLREKTGLSHDGAELADRTLGFGSAGIPMLAFNSLRTEPERSEQIGLLHLIKGLFGAFRNVTAHAPKISWLINEQDALDLLTLASLIHRRLDSSVRTGR